MSSVPSGYIGGCQTRVQHVSNVGQGKERSGRYSRREGNKSEAYKLMNSVSHKDERLENRKARLHKKLELKGAKNAPTPSEKCDSLLAQQRFHYPLELDWEAQDCSDCLTRRNPAMLITTVFIAQGIILALPSATAVPKISG